MWIAIEQGGSNILAQVPAVFRMLRVNEFPSYVGQIAGMVAIPRKYFQAHHIPRLNGQRLRRL